MGGKSNTSTMRQIVYTVAVTPSNDDLAFGVCRALMVAEDGTVPVTYPNGMTDTLTLAAGTVNRMSLSTAFVAVSGASIEVLGQ
jgi:hypothetical protein